MRGAPRTIRTSTGEALAGLVFLGILELFLRWLESRAAEPALRLLSHFAALDGDDD